MEINRLYNEGCLEGLRKLPDECAARKLGRNYIGHELNADYIKIAEKRIYNELGIFS